MKLSVTVLALTLLLTTATAQTFKVFYTFHFTDGSNPNGDLIRDSAGNFYGTRAQQMEAFPLAGYFATTQATSMGLRRLAAIPRAVVGPYSSSRRMDR